MDMERDKGFFQGRQSHGGLHLGARTSMLPYELESRINYCESIGGIAAGPWQLPVGCISTSTRIFFLLWLTPTHTLSMMDPTTAENETSVVFS